MLMIIDAVKRPRTLLAPGASNAKLSKNERPTWSLNLAQHKMSGVGNVCGFATPGCIKVCVGSCGMATVFKSVHRSRIEKTKWFFSDLPGFVRRLTRELHNKDKWCRKRGVRGAVRLNCYSDLPWEKWIDVNNFSNLEFYDYTKNFDRAAKQDGNYRLCYSVNENTDMEKTDEYVRNGGTAAVVLTIPYVNKYNKAEMPTEWRGLPLIDGDEQDDRSLDPPGCYVGLRLKGTMAKRRDAISTGFARAIDGLATWTKYRNACLRFAKCRLVTA
jgi:hypothetical protein